MARSRTFARAAPSRITEPGTVCRVWSGKKRNTRANREPARRRTARTMSERKRRLTLTGGLAAAVATAALVIGSWLAPLALGGIRSVEAAFEPQETRLMQPGHCADATWPYIPADCLEEETGHEPRAVEVKMAG